MAAEIILPRVDMDMEAGKITHWFVAEGDAVSKGQPLFEIETDKAAMEIESPGVGIVRGLSTEIGEMLPVGSVVGWLYAPDEVLAPAKPPVAAQKPAAAVAAAPAAPPAEPAAASPEDLRATPKARKLAREQGIDLTDVAGAGPLGRVQARDVEAIAARPAPKPAPAGLNREWLARGHGNPIAFVHGFGADLNAWRPLHGHLVPGRGHLAFDLPGHGLSKLGEELTTEAFADALEATLDAENIEAAHFVAHSLGAAVAATFAARQPARVRSLTLVSPAGLGPEFNGAFLAGFLAARSEASLAPWIRMLAAKEAALGAAMVKTTLRVRRERDLAEPQSRIAEAFFPDGAQAFDIRAALANYPGPARVVFGLEDRIVPASTARALPGAIAVHLFAGIGHMPHFEARAELAGIVEDNVAAGERRA